MHAPFCSTINNTICTFQLGNGNLIFLLKLFVLFRCCGNSCFAVCQFLLYIVNLLGKLGVFSLNIQTLMASSSKNMHIFTV